MLNWLADLWRAGHREDSLDDLRRERRRLQDLLARYRDFGFDAVELDARLDIRRLDRRIRSLERSAS